MPLTLDQLNTAPADEAARMLAGLHEHSPWIAEQALARRPFRSLAHLKHCMVQVLADAGLFRSRSEARTFVGQGGASINGVAVSDVQRVLTLDDLLPGGFIALRKGRKSWHVVRVTDG